MVLIYYNGGMEKYLISVDLDDTFLTREKKITRTSIKYARKLYDMGSYVVINTGRPFQGADQFLKMLGISGLPMICCNGGAIVYMKDDFYTIDHTITFEMDNAKWHELYARTRRFHYAVEATTIYAHYATDYSRIPDFVIHKDPRVQFIEGSEGIRKGDHFINSTFYIPKDQSDEFEAILKEYPEFDYIKWTGDPKTNNFETHSINADKGKAMLYLANMLKIKKENTFGFGDQLNDLSLIKAAHYGVAMINAVDEVKQATDYVTEEDFDHDGVIKFVQKITQL
jgi:Cof subfamily protein (haloacid dehalogenase superfamily)